MLGNIAQGQPIEKMIIPVNIGVAKKLGMRILPAKVCHM
jgi:hypothetical protein